MLGVKENDENSWTSSVFRRCLSRRQSPTSLKDLFEVILLHLGVRLLNETKTLSSFCGVRQLRAVWHFRVMRGLVFCNPTSNGLCTPCYVKKQDAMANCWNQCKKVVSLQQEENHENLFLLGTSLSIQKPPQTKKKTILFFLDLREWKIKKINSTNFLEDRFVFRWKERETEK